MLRRMNTLVLSTKDFGGRFSKLMSDDGIRIFIIAFILRFILVVVFPDLIPEPEDKLERYDPIALSLLEGKGFSLGDRSTAYAAPVYPAFLSVVYFLFGYSRTMLRVFLSLIEAGNCLLVYAIAKNFFAGRIPILAGVTLAFHPSFIALVFTGTSESLFVFLHTLFVYVLCFAFHKQTVRSFLLSGILLGVATLCRAVALLLPAFILPVFFVSDHKNHSRSFFHYTIFILAFAFTLFPWIVRNYLVFDRFVPVQSSGGVHFYWATPGKRGSGDGMTERERTATMDEIGKDEYYYSRAFERIRKAPAAFFEGMGRRFLQMWYKTHSGTHDATLLFLNGGLLFLATVGIAMIRSRWKELSLLWCVIAYYIILHMFLIALARYLLPVVPILTIFAMIPINDFLNRWVMLSSRLKSPAEI
jgi:4-amino-4-deoxy-L-arabinose transferase-like glycosyltransferase